MEARGAVGSVRVPSPATFSRNRSPTRPNTYWAPPSVNVDAVRWVSSEVTVATPLLGDWTFTMSCHLLWKVAIASPDLKEAGSSKLAPPRLRYRVVSAVPEVMNTFALMERVRSFAEAKYVNRAVDSVRVRGSPPTNKRPSSSPATEVRYPTSSARV